MFDPAPEFTELITAIRQTKYLEKALRFLESPAGAPVSLGVCGMAGFSGWWAR